MTLRERLLRPGGEAHVDDVRKVDVALGEQSAIDVHLGVPLAGRRCGLDLNAHSHRGRLLAVAP